MDTDNNGINPLRHHLKALSIMVPYTPHGPAVPYGDACISGARLAHTLLWMERERKKFTVAVVFHSVDGVSYYFRAMNQ